MATIAPPAPVATAFVPRGANGAANYSGAPIATPSPQPSASFVPRAADGSANYGAPAQVVSPVPVASAKPSTAPISGTVLSNANVIENTIPKLNNAASALTPAEPTTLALPETDYNKLYSTAYEGLPDETQDPIYKQEVDLINNLQSNNDSVANASVNSIQRSYADLAARMQERDQATTNGVNNSLLLAGSSRYAPVSSAGVLDVKTRADMQDLADLQDQENQKIASVKEAQSSQNYQLLARRLDELDKLRSDKQSLAKSIATDMQTKNKTLRDQAVQSSRDNTIAGLVEQGVTEPSKILNMLNEYDNGTSTGGNFTADEVSKALTAIQKNTGQTSLEKLGGGVGTFYTLKNNGQLPADIASLPENQQLFSYLKSYKTANTAPAKSSAKSSGAGGNKPLVSGTLTYTASDFADDSKALEASRGSDKYVDPDVYQTLATAWTSHGGKLTDFLKTYPPKNYINPANTLLPAYLRPSSKANSTPSSGVPASDTIFPTTKK